MTLIRCSVQRVAVEMGCPGSSPLLVVYAQAQFVDHFSGCQLCTQQSKDKGAYRECEAEFLRSYEFASAALRDMPSPPPPRNATHFQQLAATPYCQVHALPHFLN